MPSQDIERDLDSGCLRHMTNDQYLFASLSRTQGGTITFGDYRVGKIVSINNIGKPPSTILDNILLVHGLKVNLISE